VTGKKLKILVVDDTRENRMLVKVFMKRLGHETVLAENGEEAITVFREQSPDIILMDVMMPVMDGYEATKRIRELCGKKWVPIIFMSANVAVEDQIQGIEAGGDDYLPKPINMELLRAKIGAMQRIAQMQAQLNQYHAEAQSELDLARKLVDNMTHNTGLNDPAVRCWLESADQLSGDLIAASRTLDDKLYVMVADATGHGLSAAMSQLPVSQCFYEMTRKGYSIPSIVADMNSKLESMLTVGRYVAATVASVDFKNRLIEVWNGAGPEAFFVNAGGEVLKRFPSTECALGIIDDGSYRLQTIAYQWDEPGELIIYSDGLLDVANSKGELYGDERLLQTFQSDSQDSWFASIKNQIQSYYDRKQCFDDISLLTVRCDSQAGATALKVVNNKASSATG
jgi:CheY-like chemotaxis protein